MDFGVLFVDVNGNLIGSEENGFLYPIPVDNASWDPKFNFATDSTVQKIMLGFDFDRLFQESTMYQITPDEAGINFTSLTGLFDVLFTNETGAGTFDAVTFDAKLCFGTALNKILYSGAVALTDWTLENVTAASVIGNPSGIVEGPDGTYTLAFAAQSSLDVIKVSVSKNGYVGEVLITLP